jgi:hypothetical protein
MLLIDVKRLSDTKVGLLIGQIRTMTPEVVRLRCRSNGKPPTMLQSQASLKTHLQLNYGVYLYSEPSLAAR